VAGRAGQRDAVPWGRADRRALLALNGLPLVLLSLPALAGYPLLTGDDLDQTYPLSVLAGAQLRHGHLPVLDPLVWSGTPLLAGINARVVFPTTLLFAFLPGLVAWVLAEAAAFGAAATGSYLFLRDTRCAPLASGLAAAAYGLGGFLSSQAVHVDFLTGAALLPWLALVLHRLAQAEARPPLAEVAALALVTALLGCCGSPDVVVDALVVVGCYGGALLWRLPPGRRTRVAGALVAGGVLGTVLAAVQWLPGALFVAVSERAAPSLAYVSAGSLTPRYLLFLLAPHLLGGGPIGLVRFVGGYNLAELDAYPGVLPLAALGALIVHGRREGAARHRPWLVVAGVGLLLALGSTTPLERLVHLLPVVGDQRLPSRALVSVALGCSLAYGYWLDDLLAPDASRPPRRVRVAELAGPAAVLAVLAAAAVGGKRFAAWLDGPLEGPWSLSAVAPYLLTAGATALAAGVVLAVRHRLPPRRLRALLATVALADLVLFNANQSSFAPVSASVLPPHGTLERRLVRELHGGRVLLVDPEQLDGRVAHELASPDLNVLAGIPSAGGYGSLAWGPYAAATGTHAQNGVDPAALAGPTFDRLDVTLLLSVPSELVVPLAPGAALPASDAFTAAPGTTATRYLGGTLALRSLTLRLSGPRHARLSPANCARVAAAVRLFGSDERASRTSCNAGVARLTFAGAPRVAGVAFGDPLSFAVRLAPVATPLDGPPLALDGPLAPYLVAPHWVPAGNFGPFAAYRDTRAAGAFSLETPEGRPAPGVLAVLSGSLETSDAVVRVELARPALLLRSAADLPGSRVVVLHAGRATARAPLRLGLVEAVPLPAGESVVRFSYDAPGLGAGLALSAVGLALLAGLAIAALRDRRRRAARADAGADEEPARPPVGV
jgi:hypothetical protein